MTFSSVAIGRPEAALVRLEERHATNRRCSSHTSSLTEPGRRGRWPGFKKHFYQALMLMLTLALTGCVVLPFPTFGRQVGPAKKIQTKDLSFIESGRTTHAELAKNLGVPWAYYEDLHVLVYYWETQEWVWFFGGAVGGGLGAGKASEVSRLHYLFVQLDEHDLVQRFGFTKSSETVSTKDLATQWSKKTPD